MNRFPCEIIFGEIGLGMNGIEQGASRKYVVIFTGWRSDGVTAKFDFLRLAVSRQPRGRFAVFFFLPPSTMQHDRSTSCPWHICDTVDSSMRYYRRLFRMGKS